MNKQVPIVVALISDDQNRALIARRNDPGLIGGHNKWELIGGKIEFGEDPEVAIIREVYEESGLQVEVTKLARKLISRIWEKSDGQHQVILIPYHCSIVSGELHSEIYDEKIAELRFISESEIDEFEYIGPREKELVALTFEK